MHRPDYLEGAIDLHVHSAPDIDPRRYHDLELAREAAGAGMAGLLLKNHQFSTVERAWLVSQVVHDVCIFGGLVLNETVLQSTLGLDAAARASGERIGFTEDVREAWHAVDSGAYGLAFLVQAVRVDQIVAIADVGELLPQKSTYFYPKMATGMVLNPLD